MTDTSNVFGTGGPFVSPGKGGGAAPGLTGPGVAGINGFRLSAANGVPVPTTNIVGTQSIYFTPFRSQAVALHTGGLWTVRTTAQITLSVTDRTAGLPVDVFAYWTGAAVALEKLDWTNATTRATALVRQDGVWVKSGDTTRRYIGTFLPRPSEGTNLDWITSIDLNGAPNPISLDIWNVSNRVRIGLSMIDDGGTFTWCPAGWQQWRADADAQVEVIVGLQEESMSVRVDSEAGNQFNDYFSLGVGFDSAALPHAQSMWGGSITSGLESVSGVLTHQPPIGAHFYSWLQFNLNLFGVTTWYGQNSGMNGTWVC